MRVFKKAAAAALALLMVAGTVIGGSGVQAKAAGMLISGNPIITVESEDRGKIRQEDSLLVLTYGPDKIKVEAGKTYRIVQRFVLSDPDITYNKPSFFGKSENDMITVSDIEVKQYDPTAIVTGIRMRASTPVEISYTIHISELAKTGKIEYGLTAYDSRVSRYDENKNPVYSDTGAFKISVEVLSACTEPTFVLTGNPRISAKAGEYVDIPVTLTNKGELDAYDVHVSIGSATALIVSDTLIKQKMPMTPAGESFTATFRFLVDAEAKSERLSLPITVSCRDLSGAAYTETNYSVVVDIAGIEEFTSASSFVVKNVTQSPEKPQAGENVTVTFDLENNGDTDFRNVRIFLGNVSSNGFEPIDSNPYILIGDLKARTVKKMTLTYKCGKNISGGTNPLTINFTGENKHGAGVEGTATVYILNTVPSRSGGDSTGVSKPKLMVTDFGADIDDILAGSKFNFTFKIKNTNDETVAKNIKVKVTSSSFSVTAGSNTFFVSEILPGEEAALSINLKASSTLQTGAYPINVEMEYEYDAETKNNETGNGVTATDELLLQVNELLRAQCENVVVGDWNSPSVGVPCPLTFEFYNMGRSTLNNVYVTVEGDFELATGNSHYIGNVGPGSPEYVECSVRPLVSGEAVCTFIIHMEDSNGDEVTRENTTTVYVEDGGNGGGYNPGGIIIDDPGFDPGMIDDPGIAEEDKKVNWALIGGIAAAVAVVIAVVVIVVVKNKKKKTNEDEFDD